MQFDASTYSPRWTEGLPFRPPLKDRVPGHPSDSLFHSLSSIGAMGRRKGGWQFEPSLPPDLTITTVLVLNSGYRIHFREAAPLTMIQVSEGRWMGTMPESVMPELFAADKQIHTENRFRWLEVEDETVGLLHSVQDDMRRLILEISPENPETLRASVEEHLKAGGDAARRFDAEIDARAEWVARMVDSRPLSEIGPGLELLVNTLEPADGVFNSYWVRDPDSDTPAMTLSMLPGILPALTRSMPDIAVEIVTSLAGLDALTEQALPDRISVKGELTDAPPAPPTLARSVLASHLPHLPEEVAKRFTDLCTRQAGHFLDGWDPSSTPLPQWTQPETAFTPETCDSDLVTIDLACLIISELEACATLTGRQTAYAKEVKELRDRILTEFWSRDRNAFIDKTTEGRETKRVTASTLLPLLWNPGPDSIRIRAIAKRLQGTDGLRDPEGIRQWEPLDDDSGDPPVRTLTQHILFPVLDTLPAETVSLITASWGRSLAKQHKHHPITAGLRLRLGLVTRRVNPDLEKYPAWVRTLERYRKAVVGTAAVLLFLIPVIAGIIYLARPEFGRQQEQVVLGHAQTLYDLKRYEESIEVYTRLIDYSRPSKRQAVYYFRRGNSYYFIEQYESALQDYKKAMELDTTDGLYLANWNLAQAYRELGQIDEAIQTIETFLSIYGEDDPVIRERAENALALLKS